MPRCWVLNSPTKNHKVRIVWGYKNDTKSPEFLELWVLEVETGLGHSQQRGEHLQASSQVLFIFKMMTIFDVLIIWNMFFILFINPVIIYIRRVTYLERLDPGVFLLFFYSRVCGEEKWFQNWSTEDLFVNNQCTSTLSIAQTNFDEVINILLLLKLHKFTSLCLPWVGTTLYQARYILVICLESLVTSSITWNSGSSVIS